MDFNNYWRDGYFYGMIALCFLLLPVAWKRLGPILSLTWVYFLVRSIFVFFNTAEPLVRNMGMAMDQTSGQAFAQLMLMPLAVMWMPRKYFKYWKEAFLVFGVINGLVLVISGYGVFNAHSLDAAMLAQLVPLAPLWLAVLFILASLLVPNAATAWLMLSSYGLLMAYRIKKLRWFIVIGVITAFYFAMRSHGFHSSGRIDAWIRFFVWWEHDANIFFGTGPGTFIWLGPYIDGMRGNVFLQMHNDWLQILFEGGILGFSLSAGSYCYLLYHAKDRPRIFLALVGLGFFCLTYHPFRFFPSSFFIVCLIREVLSSAHTFEPSTECFDHHAKNSHRRK